MSAFDEQVGGSHYKKMKMQPLQFIVANDLNFLEGSVIKYVCRYGAKNGVEDLKKARHYIDMLIEMESTKNPPVNTGPVAYFADDVRDEEPIEFANRPDYPYPQAYRKPA